MCVYVCESLHCVLEYKANMAFALHIVWSWWWNDLSCRLPSCLPVKHYSLCPPSEAFKARDLCEIAWQPLGGGWAVEKDLFKVLTYVCCSQTPERKVDAPAHLSGESKVQWKASPWPQVRRHYRKDLDSTCQQLAATLGQFTCQAELDLWYKEAKPHFLQEPFLPVAVTGLNLSVSGQHPQIAWLLLFWISLI